MTFNLLFDLDDTLLENGVESFTGSYIKALAGHLSKFVPPEKMVRQLLFATDRMIQKNSTLETLEHVFDRNFYPELGLHKDEMTSVIRDFYATTYPTLRGLTRPKPGARQAVEDALNRDDNIIVATNPLFPRTAVEQRLDWAGFNISTTPIKKLSSFEKYHFAKPNPAFFAETVAQIGYPQQPTIMVGNSLKDDILPAAELGYGVYWVDGDPAGLPIDLGSVAGAGPISELTNWISEVGYRVPVFTPKSFPSIMAVLRSTPGSVETICSQLSKESWRVSTQPGEWNPTEVICHLRDVDLEVNLARLRKVLEGSNPFLPGVETDQWPEQRQYSLKNGKKALSDFFTARQEIIELVDGLDEKALELPANHSIFGPTNLKELLGFMASHDLAHVQQIYKTAGGEITGQQLQ